MSPFGNPFRMILSKGSYPSSKHLDLLNTFEETLSVRLKELNPTNPKDILSLSWMKTATHSLCETHADIKILITALELPVRDWDEKWIDIYLSNSMKLLDICLAFTSEISRLRQGHLFLTCALHDLKGANSKNFMKTYSSLDEWKRFISSKNHRLNECFTVMDNLAKTLDLPKTSKGKVLMTAMYGVKVFTLFVCSAFLAAFSGSGEKLLDLQVPDTCLWARAFSDVQDFVNSEIRKRYSEGACVTVLKELQDVYVAVSDMCKCNDSSETMLGENVSRLEKLDGELYCGLDEFGEEVDGFFKVILSGRDALLCNLRFVGDISDDVRSVVNVGGQAVR